MDERRNFPRKDFWLPLEIGELTGGVAVGHNASEVGLLIVAAGKLPEGQEVTVTFRLPPTAEQTTSLQATVVRSSVNERDPGGLWPVQLALKFVKPFPELPGLLADFETSRS